MKYIWVFLLIAGCTNYSETRNTYVYADNGSTLTFHVAGVDVATSRETGQTATSDADLDAALSQMGATAANAAKGAVLDSLDNVFRPESNPTNSYNTTESNNTTNDNPGTGDTAELPAVVVAPEVAEALEPVVVIDDAKKPGSVLIDGEYRGRSTDNRPTWDFGKKMADFPATFTLSIDGCYEGVVKNNGTRWQTANGGYVVKQSDKSGWNTALFAPASCQSEKANFNYNTGE